MRETRRQTCRHADRLTDRHTDTEIHRHRDIDHKNEVLENIKTGFVRVCAPACVCVFAAGLLAPRKTSIVCVCMFVEKGEKGVERC